MFWRNYVVLAEIDTRYLDPGAGGLWRPSAQCHQACFPAAVTAGRRCCCGTAETENKIKDETKATIRCIPLDAAEEEGKCIISGKPSSKRVLFAKSY